MKHLLLTFAVLTALISCNSKPDALKTDVAILNPQPITSDYATDKASVSQIPAAQDNKRIKYIGKHSPVKIIYQDVPVKTTNTAPVYLPPVIPQPPVIVAPTEKDSATSNTGTVTPGKDNSSTTDQAGTTATQPEVKKKGWNNATKGAVIGGVVGAAGGAIISKKKGTGAIIGGVVGAAGGYIFGRSKDKKATSEFAY